MSDTTAAQRYRDYQVLRRRYNACRDKDESARLYRLCAAAYAAYQAELTAVFASNGNAPDVREVDK